MSHVVWLDGGLVDPAAAALPITDPGVRWGDGLFETMRGEGGHVPLINRHMARLQASITALGLAPAPSEAEVRRAVQAVMAEVDGGVHRVRVTVTTRPTLLVEATAYEPDPAPGVTVTALVGTWWAGDEIREHKTLSYAGHRMAQRRAAALGADHALLLDDLGQLGEADAANVFVVMNGTLVTPPVEGILGGVTRDVLMEAAEAEARRSFAATRMIMTVIQGRDALIAFYARRGYVATGNSVSMADIHTDPNMTRGHDLILLEFAKDLDEG